MRCSLAVTLIHSDVKWSIVHGEGLLFSGTHSENVRQPLGWLRTGDKMAAGRMVELFDTEPARLAAARMKAERSGHRAHPAVPAHEVEPAGLTTQFTQLRLQHARPLCRNPEKVGFGSDIVPRHWEASCQSVEAFEARFGT